MSDNGYRREAWQLEPLFPSMDGVEVEGALTRLEADVEAFEAYRPLLAGDEVAELEADRFRAMLEAYEALARQIARLHGYAFLAFAADTQDQQIQAFMARIRQVAAEIDNRTMFFKLWWKGLEAAPADRLLEEAGPFRYWLESLRLQRPHTLSEPEERVINLKNVNGVQALNTLYDAITNRYTFSLTVDGQEKELNREELSAYYRHPDPDVRAEAYQELFRVYGEDAPILGQIYQARVRDWHSEYVQLRHYESPIAVRNLANDIPAPIVNTLLEVCQENRDLFQRYFRLKAGWLGMDQLRRDDIYAPVASTEKTYDFADAVDLVLESYSRFEPEVGRLARRVFDEHRLDSEVRRGKRGGAFCATITPDMTPWVLQTFQGRPNDVATMAHELGHAVHSMLAAHHPLLTQRASLPLAETASTFGEMLLVDRMLEEASDPTVQHTLLFRQMDDAYGTIMRQAYFALFERAAHEQIKDGAPVEAISTLYLENLQDQFGDALSLDEAFRQEWVVIPHIYKTPFYVYAYAFGQLLVLSLYRQYREEGESFKPRYLDILAAGGSDAPVRILKRAGIEVEEVAFWQGGFEVLRDLLHRLEDLPLPAVPA